ncbi:unnamed protein product [Discula destructiva]
MPRKRGFFLESIATSFGNRYTSEADVSPAPTQAFPEHHTVVLALPGYEHVVDDATEQLLTEARNATQHNDYTDLFAADIFDTAPFDTEEVSETELPPMATRPAHHHSQDPSSSSSRSSCNNRGLEALKRPIFESFSAPHHKSSDDSSMFNPAEPMRHPDDGEKPREQPLLWRFGAYQLNGQPRQANSADTNSDTTQISPGSTPPSVLTQWSELFWEHNSNSPASPHA